MHFVSEDHCLLELVDPDTKAPIELTDRATGEMVFTFLDWHRRPARASVHRTSAKGWA